jgi:rhodanese-related sulfurtransferase
MWTVCMIRYGTLANTRSARLARAAGRPYLGDATPAQAWALHRSGAARLADLRTQAEWLYLGHVEGVPLVEWRAFGAQHPNPRFLEQLAEIVPHDAPVLLLCRSGVRSQSAAQAATEAGWRAAGLPWVQS